MFNLNSTRRSDKRRPRSGHDYGLVGVVGVLLLIGVILIYTISPALSFRTGQSPNFYVYKHLANIALALGGFFVASKISIERWRQLMPLLLVGVGVTSLLLLIPQLSITAYGATRWISIGGISFQPSELVKLVLILYLSFVLASKSEQEIKDPHATIIPVSVVLGVLGLLLVIVQRDLGTMVVITGITLGMLFFRGVPLGQLGILTGALGGLAALSIAMFPHRIARLFTFLNAADDPLGASYHVNQALNAIGSGGLFGQGLGRSVQVYGYLPEAENDSVFAILGEVFGFFGTLVVLALFAVLIAKLLSIAKSQTDTAKQLIATGVMLWIVSHIIINVGAMLSLMPLTGLVLPFLSLGGSSLLLMMVGLGLAFQLSGSTQTTTSAQPTRHRSRDRRRPSLLPAFNKSSRMRRSP